jgi:hypothetical protein
MPGSLTVLGVRHHGPGSARAVAHALDAIRPDAVLIEGPPDAADILALAGDPTMTPPVALLVYSPESPQDASYYPFAEFSPEWQAIRWGLANNAATRFIDLACALRCKREPPPEPDADGTGTEDTQESDSTDTPPTRSDPLNALAEAAGYTDGEAWWGRLIEERRHHGDPLSAFEAVGEAMASAREQLGPTPHDPDEPAREAHMRKCIRAALREGHERIVVVCGAWHAPVLTAEAIQATTAKADDEQLKGLTKRKTAATWIPWTYERLSFHTGYGAGIHSPGWYEHLWRHPDRTNEQWLTRVARLMRQEQLDASPAAVIEAVRLAETLAAVRDRSSPGLEELSSATLAVLCHGQTLPLQIIHRELIVGSRLGTVPESAPSVPLQKDLAAQQKSLRLKLSEEVTTLDLDQRKETDLARSRLLHRLTLLAIPWGEREQDQRQRVSTFHEVWRLQWRPELAVAVLDAARWGNTVAQAAEASITDRAAKATTLDFVVSLLDHAMLADLPGSVATLIDRTAALAAVGAEIGHLMDAVPTLARILRYGDVRQTDAAMVRPLLAATIAPNRHRAAVGLFGPGRRRRRHDANAGASNPGRPEHPGRPRTDRPVERGGRPPRRRPGPSSPLRPCQPASPRPPPRSRQRGPRPPRQITVPRQRPLARGRVAGGLPRRVRNPADPRPETAGHHRRVGRLAAPATPSSGPAPSPDAVFPSSPRRNAGRSARTSAALLNRSSRTRRTRTPPATTRPAAAWSTRSCSPSSEPCRDQPRRSQPRTARTLASAPRRR